MPSIVFENVSKRFVLHHNKTRSFQDLALRTIQRRKNGNGTHEDFWALRDVSFEVPQGQMVGFIGPNGAGKSTILKLISRILQPTGGRVKVTGRINALIELSAGFHPDLTGRENIYLSAALLGLSRADIQRQFDEIVAFSELEKFIDTQVKHYSSGMQVRLGFAVATCIESEILLVDEVLAVGDANFKRKSYQRIAEIRERGTSIILVSHQLDQIERSCDRTLLLTDGRIEADGDPTEIIQKYQDATAHKQSKPAYLDLCSADYVEYTVPATARVGERLPLSVTVRNTSAQVWHGLSGSEVVFVSLGYRWFDSLGELARFPSPRIILPQDLRPGECVTLRGFAIPPSEPGLFHLELDLMVEGKGWFSSHGCIGPKIKLQVLPASG